MRKIRRGSHGACGIADPADVRSQPWTAWPGRSRALLAVVALFCSALIIAGPAAVAAPVSHARPAGTVAVKFTASVHGHRCVLRAAGRKNRGYLALRVVRDTCRPDQLRIRAAGQGVLPDRFYAGNWVDKTRQLTSINIAPNVYSDFGYDWQCNWPRHAAHRCKVRYVSKDNGAGASSGHTTAALGFRDPPCTFVAAFSHDQASHFIRLRLRRPYTCKPRKTQFRAAGVCLFVAPPDSRPVYGNIISKVNQLSTASCAQIPWIRFGWQVRWKHACKIGKYCKTGEEFTRWWFHRVPGH